jgi:CelD/BcsL family acetyltransferase involved in cellulose biosynthesis
LCETVAKTKGFDFGGSSRLMENLLARSCGDAEARLFLGRLEGRPVAGAFVIRCGRSIHYFWGAVDRAAAHSRAGEAVQWAAIEWGVSQGCALYDLEGIDPADNPGTYAFKKKMGGEEVTLAGKHYYPLGLRGRAVAWADRTFR